MNDFWARLRVVGPLGGDQEHVPRQEILPEVGEPEDVLGVQREPRRRQGPPSGRGG